MQRLSKRWEENSADHARRKDDFLPLLIVGIERVLHEHIAYGNDEITAAILQACRKYSIRMAENDIAAMINEQRRNLERIVPEDPDLDEEKLVERLRMQDSERFMLDQLDEMRSWSHISSVCFGVDAIDREIYGIKPKETCVVVGAQGSMKTSFALGALEDALSKGMSVLFLSIDMTPGEIQVRRIMRRLDISSVMFEHMLANGDDMEIRQAAKEIADLDRGLLMLRGNAGQRYDIDMLRDELHRRRPALFIIDYLTLLRRKGQSDLDCVNEVIPEIVDITQAYGLRSILLSQMGRSSKSEQAKGISGGHSKGGGIVEERAYFEIELYKDISQSTSNPEIIATITKNRRGPSGMSFSLECKPHCYLFPGGAERVWRDASKPVKPMYTRIRPGTEGLAQ